MYTNGAINKKVKNYFSPASLKISRLYLFPKLHEPGIPGRPIVSSCDWPTVNISRFVHYFLQPLTRALPRYHHTGYNWLPSNAPRVTSLPTRVRSGNSRCFLTNIPHDKGVNVCEGFLNTRTDQSPPTKALCQLTQLILESNALIFNGTYYLRNSYTMPSRALP